MLPAPLERCGHALQQRQQAALHQEEQQLSDTLGEVQQGIRDPGLELQGQRAPVQV